MPLCRLRDGGDEATDLHVESRTIRDIVVDPDHTNRTESTVFYAATERLCADGHYKCWICGTDKDTQIHHFVAEYMFEDIADLDKAKEVANPIPQPGETLAQTEAEVKATESYAFMLALQPSRYAVCMVSVVRRVLAS